jgi:hypothetical protein
MNWWMPDSVKRLALDQLVKVLDRVPIVSSVKSDLGDLRALLYDRRPPRIAALGLPSSGRSSLIRALIERGEKQRDIHAEHGEWVHIEHAGSKVDWIEVDVASPDARSHWEAALDIQAPDLVLITVEPSTLDDVPAMLERCKSLLRSIPDTERAVRVFPLLTHADLIEGDEEIDSRRRALAQALRTVAWPRTLLASCRRFLGAVCRDCPKPRYWQCQRKLNSRPPAR